MHRKLFFIAVLVCAALFQAGAADTYEEREGSGLEIMSEPSNAKVYINGIERGYTPLSLPNLMPGSYVVWLVKETYADRQVMVTVPQKGRVVISLDMERATGMVMIHPQKAPGVPSSVPFEPEIYVDGEYQQGGALALHVGFRNIRVRAFGFDDVSKTIAVQQGTSEVIELEMKPALYSLGNAGIRRSRFNPANSGSLGTTECTFEVSAPGKGVLRIMNSQGAEVYSMELGPFTTWSQNVIWNGRTRDGTIVPDGTYTINIDTESIPWDDRPLVKQSAALSVVVDSSISIFPETMASAKSGLLFAAGTDILPRGSFQLDALMLFGKPPATEDAWSNLPMAFAFRVSPVSFLEAAVSLNITPEFGSSSVIGVGGSVKWQIMKARELPLGLAAVLSYGWAQEGPMTPFAMGTGPEISIPVSWSFGNSFMAFLTPGLLWSGPDGYPDSGVPGGILSAGFSYRHAIFNTGLSLRTEYLFENRVSLGPVLIGGEIKFFPGPSVFVFSAMAGVSYEDSTWGGFGGIGIGFIQ